MAYIGKRPVDTFPANNAVTASIISANAVGSSEIANGAVGIAELAANAVTSAKLAQNSVLTKHIDDGQVTTDQLGADAVTAAKLADDAVVTANIVDANVTTAKIADDNVTTAKIADSNVTTAKIADDAVTLAKMAGLARGKIIVGDSSGNPSALALGSNGQILKSDGTDLVFAADSGLSTEEVQDIVGGMFSGNTETNITATYQDSDGTIDLVVPGSSELNSTSDPSYHTVLVTVVSSGGNKYALDGNTQAIAKLTPSVVYRFDQSDSSNSGHPLRFSETSNGTHGGGSEISSGTIIYNKVGTPGSSGAYTEVAFKQGAFDLLYYYCSNHSGMGAAAAIADERALTQTLTNKTLTSPTINTPTITSPAVTGTATFGGSDGVSIAQGYVKIKNGGTQSYVDFYCESSNAHYARLQAPAHSAFSGNITLTLPATTDTLVGRTTTDTLTNKTLTSPNVTGLQLSGTTVTSTAAELNLLDGVTATTAEINLLDGGTAATSTTLVNADRLIINDNGTMKQVELSDLATYMGDNVTINQTQTALTVSGNTTIGGNLTVNGTTTTLATTNSVVADRLIELGNGTTGTPANDTGIVMERGDAANAFMGFDESADKFIVGTGTFTGASTGDLSITTGTLVANIEGNVTGNVTGNVSGSAGSATGNAATATALQNARTIHGVSFDGTANIDLTEVVQDTVGAMFTSNTESGITVAYQDSDGTVDFTVGTLNQDTTGNAATATALETARTIGGVSFDGTANIDLPGVNSAGNQNTTGSAATLTTARAIALTGDVTGSANFDGSAGISISSSLAADSVDSAEIADGAIDTAHIADDQITQAKIADDAVGADQLAANSVVSASIVNGSIVAADLADNCITSAKIVNGTIATADIANNAILTQHIDDNQVTGDQIGDDVVLSGTGAVTIPKGTTAQRPSGTAGEFRFNTTTAKFEGHNGTEFGEIGGGSGTSAFTRNAFTGDGSTTAFSLSSAPDSENTLIVFIEGVFQDQDAYSVSGTTLTFGTAPVNGRGIIVYNVKGAVSGTNLNHNQFSANGSSTQFTLNLNPEHENNTMVYIDGVYQNKTSYSVSGTTLDFGSGNAPPNGTTVECMIMNQTDVNVPVDDTISTAKLQDSAVTEAKIAVNAVTSLKIAENAITARELATNAIATLYLADDSVTTVKIADNAVTAAKIGQDVLTDQVRGITSAASVGSDALTIDGSEHVTILNDLIVDTSTLKVDSGNNRVGVGTTSPASALHVSGGDNTAAKLTITNTANTNTYSIHAQNNAQSLNFQEDGTNVMSLATGAKLGIGSSPTNLTDEIITITTPASGGGQGIAFKRLDSNNDQTVGSIRFSNNSTDNLAFIKVKTDGANTSSAMQFFTNTGSGSTERLRITSNGFMLFDTTVNGQGTGLVVNSTISSSSTTAIEIQQATNGANKAAAAFGVAIGNGGESTNAADLTFHAATGGSLAERARITSGGDFVVATTSTVGSFYNGASGIGFGYSSGGYGAFVRSGVNTPLYVSTLSTGSGGFIEFFQGTSSRGTITYNGSAMVYGGTSDYRLKENITPIENALAKVSALNPINFKWKDSGESSEGFLAHEAQTVVPYAVTGVKDEVATDENSPEEKANGEPLYQTVDYGKITPLLVKAIQEQQTIIDDLKARIETLEG